MIQWKYEITVHPLPPPLEKEEKIVRCDQVGQCLIHDTAGEGIKWLETILIERGEAGWELVQLGYHKQELLCIWKKRD